MRQWEFFLADEFGPEFEILPAEVIKTFFVQVRGIEQFGPEVGRPHVDTLKGSHYSNMKELRFEATGGVWRFAFAFDPERKAIILVAGDKAGVSGKRFYKQLIDKADARYAKHLKATEERRSRGKG